MIETKKYQRLLDSGLMMDHYHVLLSMRDGKVLPISRRIHGFVNLLTKKGYIENGYLTDLATELLDMTVTTTSSTTTTIREEKAVNFTEWVVQVHTNCKMRIKELTGDIQVRGKINGKAYSFMPNSIDLGKKLFKVINMYKLKDLDAIERCMINHINNCHKSKSWFPLMEYYIFKSDAPMSKDGQSRLVTDLEVPPKEGEEGGGFKSNQKHV